VDGLLARGARFRFVSRALRDELARRTNPIILERSTVIPCAVDVRGAPSRHDARARFGIDDDEKIAVVVGRLVRQKRPLEAARMALSRHASRVVVVGDGPLIRAVECLDARVSTVGLKSRADTLAWIAAADFLASASRNEGCPTAIREARALGVPVVTVPCGDVEDWARADPGIEIVD